MQTFHHLARKEGLSLLKMAFQSKKMKRISEIIQEHHCLCGIHLMTYCFLNEAAPNGKYALNEGILFLQLDKNLLMLTYNTKTFQFSLKRVSERQQIKCFRQRITYCFINGLNQRLKILSGKECADKW